MISYQSPVPYEPGKRTLKNFLAAAIQPVGCVLYLYGGGWNLEDTKGDAQSSEIGLSKDWLRFFCGQDAGFSYRLKEGEAGINYYPVHGCNCYHWAGLDCSGYVGWALYNTMNCKSGGASWVVRASQMADVLAENGLGSVTTEARTLLPGDIISMEGHVWICVGTCRDGSAVILHSTPSESRRGCPGGGVQLSALGKSEAKDSEALALADYYMKTCYPVWNCRYEAVQKDRAQYMAGRRFRWYLDGRGLADPEGIRRMGAEEILELLFRLPKKGSFVR